MQVVRGLVALVVCAMSGVTPAGAYPLERAPVLDLGATMTSTKHLRDAELLASDKPFTVRVPFEWSDPAHVAEQRMEVVRAAADRNWRIVVNLRYRAPKSAAGPELLSGFGSWASETASRVAALAPASFDVSNRPNSLVPDDPGSDPAWTASVLVAGVQAVSQTVPDARVGFSWLATGDPVEDAAWWAVIRSMGRELLSPVSFVDVQLFPGTLTVGTPWALGGPRDQVSQILRQTRSIYMPRAGLGPEIDIEVGEFGGHAGQYDDTFPLDVAQPDAEALIATQAAQRRLLEAVLEGVRDAAMSSRVTSAVWTSLADEGGCSLAKCWGLLTESGAPRSAFDEMRYQIIRASLARNS
ncbi:MAG TPA: hypothetical protein VNE62_01955 [Actinomycetota bacterium]|nr:hypothetical protein [Actinomycetota bacterium]